MLSNPFKFSLDTTQAWLHFHTTGHFTCLLYTSDAADERSSVDLGGRRIIKKKKKIYFDAGDEY